MTPHQRKIKNAMEREYAADLLARHKRVRCPRCGAKPGAPCVHDSGPRRARPMAGVHGERKLEANLRGHVRGPWFWRSARARHDLPRR